ncbi:hypothetical protein FHW69_003686 [Luteibacter sp. Sphag1AF]|uniref:hypothetical protein n=1 Tax=Luteibacter sp. Sphag1AF TaxID=2587031 RepID=UPI00161151B5|nr:hypothetical protein [Luteibacter sp. Sphag1AF]MBB3229037.1 hypothetical protein [Luteibacter sp. Sphag1AF]
MTHSTISLPPLHDGFLRGFLVKDDQVRLFVESVSGETFTVLLSGVKRFNVDGFAEGNIILDCELLASPEIPNDLLVALNHGGTSNKELEQLRAAVADGTYRLFVISPSYGATVVALIKGLSVREGTFMD